LKFVKKFLQIVKENIESEFGIRLRQAFYGAKNAEIARQLSVSSAAITNYIEGRVPPSDKLTLISTLTNCSIHWLLTGEGEKNLNAVADEKAEVEEEAKTKFVVEDEAEGKIAGLYFSYGRVKEDLG
jgi:transcriptional regulator with XRE-family HTH domain